MTAVRMYLHIRATFFQNPTVEFRATPPGGGTNRAGVISIRVSVI